MIKHLVLLSLFTLSLSHDQHHCIHDKMEKPSPGSVKPTHVQYNKNVIPAKTINAELSKKMRSLEKTSNAGGQRKPIRIHTEYNFLDNDADANLLKNIKETYMPAAVCTWSSTLSVNPVSSNLKFDRGCSSYWQVDGKPCAKFSDSPDMCGTEAIIASDWLNELTACTKQPGQECSTKSAGNGLPNTDYAIIVKATETQACIDSPQTLGYAHACRYDQYDRPILGFINFCPTAMKNTDASSAISTAEHELAHALGFSSSSFPYMREADGTTPRTARGSDGLPPVTSTVCWNGQTQTNERPAGSTTITRSTSRGNPNAFTMVTPSVKAATAKHFGCNSAHGGELENQPTGGGCTGSHWEQRLFDDELMAPISGGSVSVLSSITLSAFADMGWYTVNTSIAGDLGAFLFSLFLFSLFLSLSLFLFYKNLTYNFFKMYETYVI
jgi:leishmanolysin-like peptidase